MNASTGIITTVAGNGSYGFSGDGGPATATGLSATGVAVDASGNIYIADPANNRIREVFANVTAVTPTVTVSAANASYTGSAYDTANLATTLTPASAPGSISYAFYSDPAGQNPIADPSNAGTYYVQAFFTSSNSGYTNAQGGIVSFTITPATATVNVTGYTGGTYDGNTHTQTVTVTGVPSDGQLYTTSLSGTNAGPYSQAWSFSNANYNLVDESGTLAFTIDKASTTTTTVGAGPFTYNGSAQVGGSGTVTGAGAGVNTLNFDSVTPNAGNGVAYLNSQGITLTNVSPSGPAGAVDIRNWFGPGSSWSNVNFLMSYGEYAQPCSYTMNFATPLQSISFDRIAVAPDLMTEPQWSATAYAGAVQVGQVGESLDSWGYGSPARTFTFTGNGVTSLTISSNGYYFTGIGSVPLNGFVLTPQAGGGFSTSATSLTYSANADGTGVADETDAGTYYVTAHYAGDANHLPSDGLPVAITINKATSTTVVTINGGPFIYNGVAQTPATVSVTGAGGLSLMPAAVYANNIDAGTATASYSYAGDANHFGSSDSKEFTITAIGEAINGNVYVLNQTASGALTISGNAQLNVAGTLQVDSNSASAVKLSGNADVDAAKTLIVGGDQVLGHAGFLGTVTTGAAYIADPLAVLAAQAGTGGVAVNLSGNQTLTLNPGVYSSITVSGNAKLILTSGTYIIGSGGVTVSGNGTVTDDTAQGGLGVLIYNNGALTVSGTANLNVTAFSTGDYAGLAIFQARTDTSAVTVSGNANLNLNGSFLYDANVQSMVTISGNAKIEASMVVNELTISGNADES